MVVAVLVGQYAGALVSQWWLDLVTGDRWMFARRRIVSRRNDQPSYPVNELAIQVYSQRIYTNEQGCKFPYGFVRDHAFFGGGECRVVTLNGETMTHREELCSLRRNLDNWASLVFMDM